MLITSSASFVSGSARGLYGSGSGDNSVVVDKLLVRSHKVSTEVKFQKQYLWPFLDQDVLNVLLNNKIVFLNTEYNYQYSFCLLYTSSSIMCSFPKSVISISLVYLYCVDAKLLDSS